MSEGSSKPSIALSRIREFAADWYDRFGLRLAIGAAFLLPVRLILADAFLIPLIALKVLKRPERDRPSTGSFSPAEGFLLVIFAFFVISSLGRSPLQSVRPLVSLLFFSGTIFAFRDFAARGKSLTLLSALILGQALASLNTVLEAVFPAYPIHLIGKVSESGQIGMTIIVAAGVLAAEIGKTGNAPLRGRVMLLSPLALLFAFFLAVLAFPGSHPLPASLVLISGIVVVTMLAVVLLLGLSRKGLLFFSSTYGLLLCSLPLMFVALLNNLKRGPWAGVLAATFIFCVLYARRLVAGIIIVSLMVLILFEPVRSRIIESPADFFIAGGRSEIWQIGTEMVAKYPLGLGFKNSRYLQDYSTLIPAELKHFHNNFLNITAETGWIGFGVFLWWILSTILLAFRSKGVIVRAIGCALISWQVAGLVEYNFGDSEVLLIAFVLIGILSGLAPPGAEKPTAASEASS